MNTKRLEEKKSVMEMKYLFDSAEQSLARFL